MVSWECKDGLETVFYVNRVAVASVITPEGCNDAFAIEDGAVRWQRNCIAPTDKMRMIVQTLFEPDHTMIPGVLYDGNPFGHDHEYKGYVFEGQPYTFAHHRCAVPGATASWCKHTGFAMHGQGQCSCALVPDETGTEHVLIWPETEGPKVLHAYKWGEVFYGTMPPRTTFVGWLFFEDNGGQCAWRHMLAHAWHQHYTEPTEKKSKPQI